MNIGPADTNPGYGVIKYASGVSDIIHPTNKIRYPSLFDRQHPQVNREFTRTFPDKGVTWPGALMDPHQRRFVAAHSSVFANRRGTGYAVINRRPPPVNIIHRRPENDPQPSNEDQDDKVKVVWDKQDISQADPTPHLQSLSTEELVPGEAALLDIIREKTRSRKIRK